MNGEPTSLRPAPGSEKATSVVHHCPLFSRSPCPRGRKSHPPPHSLLCWCTRPPSLEAQLLPSLAVRVQWAQKTSCKAQRSRLGLVLAKYPIGMFSEPSSPPIQARKKKYIGKDVVCPHTSPKHFRSWLNKEAF